jgi:preprotein translocase subunit SecD
VLLVAAYAAVLGWRLTPNLGLDLQGGTTVILTPELEGGGEVDADQLAQAVDIIRNRVNGVGVAESEVVTQGDNIVISVPGEGRRVLQDLGSTAQLRFRQVLQQLPGGSGLGTPPAQPAPAEQLPAEESSVVPADPSAVPAAPAADGPAAGAPAADASEAPPADASEAPAQPRAVPSQFLSAQAPTPDPAATASPDRAAPTPDPAAAPAPTGEPVLSGTPAPGDGLARLAALDCTDPASRPVGGSPDRPEDQIVSCAQDGSAKYLLGPARVVGTDVAGAQARPPQATGVGGGWAVTVDFTGEGQEKFTQLTQETVGRQVAIVLDGVTVSAPTIQQVITGSPEITGSFDQQSAQDLANILRFGALPLTFTTSQAESVSATLGGDQLDAGLLAGAIGLGLVVLYSLFWYRGLALVTIASLAVAGLLTYAAVAILGAAIGFTLTLAGIAGLIVSIGITADSFVVYFERVKDEVRSGRSVRSAVDRGWLRARRTIISADVVQFLAAVVLYFLSVGAVRGFAFTLGLVTLIDVVVVFLFTRPLVSLAGRSRMFSRPWFLPLAPRSAAGAARRGSTALPTPSEA